MPRKKTVSHKKRKAPARRPLEPQSHPRTVDEAVRQGWTFRRGIDEASTLTSPGDGDSQLSVDENGHVINND
jgi:hypothetical protein